MINIRPGSLVILSGPPASGKSSFCSFHRIEPVSSDNLRISMFGLRNGSPSSLDDRLVFEVMESTVRSRMRAGLLTFVDSTCVKDRNRKRFAQIAEEFRAPVKVLIFDAPTDELLERNQNRAFPVPEDVLLKFKKDLMLTSKWDYEVVEDIYDTELNLTEGIPTFDLSTHDLIGDVHGLLEGMDRLAVQMGYSPDVWTHPEGRKMIFLGDVVDRGPDSIPLLLKIKRTGHILLQGNHERSLLKIVNGGLIKSRATAATYHDYLLSSEDEQKEITSFLESLPIYAFGITPDGEKALLSHAYLRDYCPVTTPTMDFIFGCRPDLDDEAFSEYLERDKPHGVTFHFHGHVPTTTEGRAVSLDTKAGFGGPISALRF